MACMQLEIMPSLSAIRACKPVHDSSSFCPGRQQTLECPTSSYYFTPLRMRQTRAEAGRGSRGRARKPSAFATCQSMTPSRSNSSPIIHSSLTSSRTDQLVDPPLPSSPATSKNISPAPLQRSPPSYLPPALRSLAAALAGGATVASLPLLSLLPSPLLALSSQPLGGFNLEGPGSVLQALAVLAVIVTVHECGHFFAARSLGMRVTKFSIGFGPTLWGFTGEKDGVEYALRAFPLGGYVGFPDDDPDSDIPADDPDLLRNRPLLERAAVISAGVVANAVFAYALLFTQVNTVGLVRQAFYPGVLVPEVVAGSAGVKAGLQPGDLILAVNGKSLPPAEQAVAALVYTVKRSVGETVSLQVQRGEEVLSLAVVPEASRDGSGRIGVQLTPNAIQYQERADRVWEGAIMAGKEFAFLLGTVMDGLRQIVTNFAQTADRVSGPVAIVAVGAEVARTNAAGLFQFSAIVNLNLAVVNLLPLPALDGGYLVLLAVEAVRGGKRIPTEVEKAIMSSGLLAFLGIGLFLIVRDSINLGFLP